jgi:hypothetical protein
MRIPAKLTAATAAITLGLASAALASGPGTHGRSQYAPGHNRSQQSSSTASSGTTTTSTTTASPSNNGKAYGRLCQAESKKHVAGQKGTPFSKCVTDMAHLAHSLQSSNGSQGTGTGQANPARTCANESKKHTAGQTGTPFSRCVSAAAKLLGEQNNQNGGSTQTSSGSGEDTTTTTSTNGS